MLNASAAIVAVTGVVGGMLVVAKSDTTNLHGEPNSAWLAGGKFGRTFLGSIGGTRPNFGVTVGDPGSEYDVATAADLVLVQDRATGEVVMLDGRNGQQSSKFSAPKPTDDRPAIVGAGDSAYAIDAVGFEVFKISTDGSVAAPVTVDGGFTDWVGASDGRLWMFDRAEGDMVTFDGESVNRAGLTDPDSDIALSVLGDDPVVLDRTAGKLHWPRRSQSIDIGGADTAVLQAPGRAAECVTVATADQLTCVDSRGVVRSIPMTIDQPETAQLFASSDNLVVAWPGRDRLVTASWHTNSTAETKRREPSARPMVGHEAIGHLLVDDPGGGFSFSVDHGTVIDLEKFSKETILISADGQVDDGGVVASDGDSSAVADLGTNAENKPQNDTNGRNDPPHATDDVATTRVNRQVQLNVLSNDVDPDGDIVAIIDHSEPSPADTGEVQIIGGSLVLFTPSDTPGTVTFEYTITDPDGLRDIGKVTVKVISDTENTDPKALDDEFETPEGVAIEMPVLLNDTDDEGDDLNFDEGLGQPSHGTVSPLTSKLVYTPEAGFTGIDTFDYFVVDGHGGRARATVRVTVIKSTGENRAPDAVDDRYSIEVGGSQTVDVLTNDTDPDGDLVSMTDLPEVEGLNLTLLPDDRVQIQVANGVSGTRTFSYAITDPGGAKDTATVSVVITSPTINRAPIGIDDRLTSSGQAVVVDPTANDYDEDNDSISLVGYKQPVSGGRVTQTGDGRLRFDPDPDVAASGNTTVTFTYTISDPSGERDTATVHIVINKPTNAPPVALPEQVDIFPGGTATLAVLANDNHPDGLDFGLDGIPSGPPNAKLEVGPNSVIEFTPLTPEIASYSFRYCIKDVNGQSACATDTVNVVAKPSENTGPVGEDDSERTERDQSVVIDVLANDHDNDGDVLSIVGKTDPSPSGRVEIENQKLRFIPAAGFTGIASFSYTLSDGTNPVATAKVTVQVLAPATIAPITKDDFINLTVGDTVEYDPVSNDDDPDGGALRLVSFASAPGVTVGRVAAGSNTLRVTSATPGTYTIAYVISDTDNQTASGEITIVVAPHPNELPVARPDFPSSMLPKGSKSIDVLSNDFDPDGGSVSVVAVTQPPGGAGTATFNISSVTFTPDPGFTGEVTFGYTIDDGEGGTDTSTVTITVNPCPPLQLFPDIQLNTRFEHSVSKKLFGGGPADGRLDVQNPPLGRALVTDETTGKVRYDPPAGFNDEEMFTYTVTNACDQVATGTVIVDVNQSPSAVADFDVTKRNVAVTVPVLANDSAGEVDDTKKLDSVGGATGGTAMKNADGTVTFSPDSAATTGSFTYTMSDEGGLTATATVTITIGNDRPRALDDLTGTIQPGETISNFDVIANDTDLNNDPLTLADSPAPVIVSGGGSIAVSNGRIVYTADAGVGGPIDIKYYVTDGLLTDGGHWKFSVNRAPILSSPPSGSGREGTAVPINGLANAFDPDSDGLSIVTTGPDAPTLNGIGSFSVNGGTITVTPGTGSGGSQITVTYVVTDGFLKSAPATLTVDVILNHAPTVNSVDVVSIFQDPVNFSVFANANANDIDGDALNVVWGPLNGAGMWTDHGNGSITVSPDGTPGTISISYAVSDNYGGVANGTLTITVV